MNISKLIRTVVLGMTLTVISVGTVQAGDDAKAAEFKAAVEKAEAARKKAASVGGEWRDTDKMIKKAKASAGKGDYGKALKLAHDAYRQGELGYKQAMGEKNAGFPTYMR